MGPPSSRSMTALVNPIGCTGAPEWSLLSSSHSCTGNMSVLVLAHCPHLMKAEPPLSSVRLSSLYHSSLMALLPKTKARNPTANTGVKTVARYTPLPVRRKSRRASSILPSAIESPPCIRQARPWDEQTSGRAERRRLSANRPALVAKVPRPRYWNKDLAFIQRAEAAAGFDECWATTLEKVCAAGTSGAKSSLLRVGFLPSASET
mmetsp:Transcript_1176/g.2781  ORF Transcript_1176/g.2781 Transcript_1176/m.2781 type:complete len:206 (+) Transcript_1176:1397-2014(+)